MRQARWRAFRSRYPSMQRCLRPTRMLVRQILHPLRLGMLSLLVSTTHQSDVDLDLRTEGKE